MREVGAHDLPLAAAFDEDQRCAAVHDPHLAILRHPGERVIRVGNPGMVVKDPTGKLPKGEGAGSQPTRRSLEKLHKLLLGIKAIGDRVEDFQVLIQQLCDCRDIDGRALSMGEGVRERLGSCFNLLDTHGLASFGTGVAEENGFRSSLSP